MVSTKLNKKKAFPSLLIVLLILTFSGELLIYAWCRVQYIQIGYEISNLADTQEQLLKIKNELVIEQARLKSPERIIRIASQQLDLKMPDPDKIKIIH